MKTFGKPFLPILTIFLLFIPFLLQAAEVQVKVINDANDLPEKFCRIWAKGDLLISDGKHLAVIGGVNRPLHDILNFPASNAMGSILSFVPAGSSLVSDLSIGSPAISIKNKRIYLAYSFVRQIKEKIPAGGLGFEATALYTGTQGRKAQVKTTYRFSPNEGRIDIISTIANTGKVAFEDLSYSLYFDAFHRYYFNPFHQEKHPNLNFRVYQKKGHYLAWLNLNPHSETPQPGKLAPGEVFEVRYILLTDTCSDSLLRQLYHILHIDPIPATILFEDFNGGLMEVVVRDAFSSSVFFRSFLEEPSLLELPLPKGHYLVKAHFFPAVCEELMVVGEGEENLCTLKDLPQGTLKVKITNSQGEFVPGKVTVIGLDPTKTPYFQPENPVETERSWVSSKNSVYPQQYGLEVSLPVGTYLIYASRGPEYTIDQQVIEVLKDESRELTFIINEVVKTPHFIAVDPHMHTHNSDGYVTVAERIKSVVAEGIEVAVASDHNYISNYDPVLNKLGLNKYLAVIAGSEVTNRGVIHYNTYPMKYRPEEEHNGAINALAEEASPLFKASRQKNPQAILQVNHPRSGVLGYFNNFNLDPESAATAHNALDTSFDVLEVMNGPNFYGSNYESIQDWLHLLNRGYYFPIVGSSDTHATDKGEPGYSRTYIFYEGETGDNLNLSALMQAIKKGRSFVSNGPVVEFNINGKYTSGDSFTAEGGKVDVWLKVDSAPWVAVDEVRLIVNGERKLILPVKAQARVIEKFTEQVSLTLDEDSYIAVEVLGKKSLYPVLQSTSRGGLLEDADLPYALTNPVFIDVDGNGKFDPPLPEKIKLTTETLESPQPSHNN
ncbi:MAG: CehA/McbA family metallohydrolase [Acidobacteriota bacterium]